MKTLLGFFLLCALSAACVPHAGTRQTLSRAEACIEQHPDSALLLLNPLSSDNLRSRKDRAKHAVLLSMALDKNYIDRTDFQLLQPAIEYYAKHGPATDRMRTGFYQGRIHQNRGDDIAAMHCYLAALDAGETSEDILTKARILVAQGVIYYSLMQWDRYCEVNLEAAGFFETAGRTESYVNCLLKAALGSIQNDRPDDAGRYIEMCRNQLDSLSLEANADFQMLHLNYLISTGTDEDLVNAIERYLAMIPSEKQDLLTLAGVHMKLENYDAALELLEQVSEHQRFENRLKYHALLTRLYQLTGKDKEALNNYFQFNTINDSLLRAVFKRQSRLAEERHALEMRTMRERKSKNDIVLFGFLAMLALITVLAGIRVPLAKRTQQMQYYIQLCQQLETERDNLSGLLARNDHLDERTRNTVAGRIELLNRFFTAHITNNLEINRNVNKEINHILSHKKEFMASTKQTFSGSHPGFIRFLEERELTEWEIQYCCLYALGLKGKEVGNFIEMRSHYNISSIIRDKLGLTESDTNLGNFLRKLLAKENGPSQ